MPKTVALPRGDGRSKVIEEEQKDGRSGELEQLSASWSGGTQPEVAGEGGPEPSIKELPQNQRPRERLARLGARSLSDAELVAVLLGSGSSGNSVLAIASALTAGGGLYTKLAVATKVGDLAQYRGLGKAKAATLLAAVELGRRLAGAQGPELLQLTDPEAAYGYLAPKLRYLAQERFLVVYLNAKNRVLEVDEVGNGNLASAVVRVSDVFKGAITANAATIMVAHNHPSGDPAPSQADHLLTQRLYEAGRLLGLPLLDHLIIGSQAYYSYREQGFIIQD